MAKQILKFQPTNVRADKAGQFDFLSKFLRRKPADGYVCVAQKDESGWNQEFYTTERLRKAISTANIYAHGDDIYITANSFVRKGSRYKNNLKTLDCCFCDIDYKKKENYVKCSPQEMTDTIFAFCRKYNVPLPTAAVSTGHGLHIWWMFRKPVDASYLPVWEAVQSAICDSFARFGADPAAKDAARVLRIPGTANTKNKDNPEKVEVTYLVKDNRYSDLKPLYNYAAKYRETLYYDKIRKGDARFAPETPLFQVKALVEQGTTQYSPAPAFISFDAKTDIDTPIVEPAKKIKHRQRVNETEQECSDRHRDAAIGVRANRIADIQTLIGIRKGNMTGHRELTLFYLNHFLLRAHYDLTHRTKILNETNNKFSEPLSQYEVDNILRHRTLQYDPRNETVIKALGITSTEQMLLRTLYNKEERERRNHQNNKHKMSRDEYRTFMSEKILAYLSDGKRINEIADLLRVTARTVRNYINRFSLSTDGLSKCASEQNRYDSVQRHRDAQKAAQQCVEEIRTKGASSKKTRISKKDKRKLFDEIFKLKMNLAQSQESFFDNLSSFVTSVFEKTGHMLAIEYPNGKVSYTPAFKHAVVLSCTPS